MVQLIKTPALPGNLSPHVVKRESGLSSMYMALHTEAKLETNDAFKTVFLTLLFFEK